MSTVSVLPQLSVRSVRGGRWTVRARARALVDYDICDMRHLTPVMYSYSGTFLHVSDVYLVRY